jgi:hypothetical protein
LTWGLGLDAGFRSRVRVRIRYKAFEAAAATALDSDLVFVEYGIIRRLPMLLVGVGVGVGSSVTVCVGLLWKPCARCRIGEYMPDKNASWNEVIDR